MRSNRPAASSQWQAWLVLGGLFVAMMAFVTSQIARQPLWRVAWNALAAAGFVASLAGGVAILARRARATQGLAAANNGRRRAYYLATILMLGLSFVGALVPWPAELGWAATALPLVLIAGATWAAVKLLRSAPPTEFSRAQKAYAEGRADEALGILKDIEQGRPEFYGAYQLLAMIRRERGEYAQAHQAARKLIELQPELYHGHAEEGLTFLDQGHPAAAIAPLTRAVEIAPKLAVAHFNLGLALVETLDRAVEGKAAVRPAGPIQRLYEDATGPAAAIEPLRQALRLGLRDEASQLIARYHLARALRAAGQADAAEKERRALRRNRAALRRWRDELAHDSRPARQRAEDQRLINEIEREMG